MRPAEDWGRWRAYQGIIEDAKKMERERILREIKLMDLIGVSPSWIGHTRSEIIEHIIENGIYDPRIKKVQDG